MDVTASPLMQQYQRIKQQHPHAALLFRVGDFYELFYDDAIRVARELQLTLTSRQKEAGVPIPMCGVPYHAAQGYISKLLQKGYRVAICEQTEDPSKTKKLVKREVTRVVTPGTTEDGAVVSPRDHNYLVAVFPSHDRIGLAYTDLSTGEFRATEFTGIDRDALCAEELAILRPKEVLLPAGSRFARSVQAVYSDVDEWTFAPDNSQRLLTQHFAVASLDGFGFAGHTAATGAAGAVLHYLQETQRASLAHLNGLGFYRQQQWMMLDAVTTRNLELVEPVFAGEHDATVIAVLDDTRTSMGGRLLRSWLQRPSLDLGEINARLDAVGELKAATVVRGTLTSDMDGFGDLERLLSRIALGTAHPRDLLSLGASLERVPKLKADLSHCAAARLVALAGRIDELADVAALLARAIAQDAPLNLADGGVIRAGFHAELDELRELSRGGKSYIAGIEARERTRTGINSLKVRFNNIFGYYIEISKPNLHLVPADFERKQTLVNAERFTTPELKDYERKVLDAESKILDWERQLFNEVREQVAAQAARIRETAAALAETDVLVNLASLAAQSNYCRPEFTVTGQTAGELEVVGGRHPVIERLAEKGQSARFVPNDLYLNDETHRILVITGPNMGGKSTYLRQAALIVILAQMGSFVPAERARLPLVDRVFTRIGASDNLARGRSTFLVEMTETAAILNTATPQSLVLLDEVGRGTATFDGLSIAWAVVEHLHQVTRAKTLFATHYHELTELAEHLPGVRNLRVMVKESGGEIVFLHRVETGKADRSYGIEVARLAGLPRPVVERAREVLEEHERSEEKVSEDLTPGASPAPPIQLTLFTALNHDVVRRLSEANLDEMRPLDALNLLAELKKQL
jgi:DNA mismatch repair protein MutS